MNRLTAILVATILASAALAGCGGSDGGDGPVTTDTAATFTPTTAQSTPISHTFTEAGTYTMAITGDFAPTAPNAGDTLNVWYSFSGQGSIASGNAEPSYAIPAGNVSTKVDESITVILTGAGPWEVTVLCNTAVAAGTMTGLTLTTQKR
jgi:hypothetical protein